MSMATPRSDVVTISFKKETIEKLMILASCIAAAIFGLAVVITTSTNPAKTILAIVAIVVGVAGPIISSRK